MATPAAEPVVNPYGLIPALNQGGAVAWGLFILMILMSAASWFIILSKWWEQRKLLRDADDAERKVWTSGNFKDGVSKLDKNSPFRLLAEDGLRAFDHHDGRLTDQIDRHEWVTMSLNRTATAISHRLSSGLAFLASVGSTAPFIGLLGTVIGIYRALVNIGLAGQASIDKVAGPVGEALIMTAIGLFVAVPAVIGYNFLNRRNKGIQERMNAFASDVHGYLMSGSRMTPTPAVAASATAAAAKPAVTK